MLKVVEVREAASGHTAGQTADGRSKGQQPGLLLSKQSFYSMYVFMTRKSPGSEMVRAASGATSYIKTCCFN